MKNISKCLILFIFYLSNTACTLSTTYINDYVGTYVDIHDSNQILLEIKTDHTGVSYDDNIFFTKGNFSWNRHTSNQYEFSIDIILNGKKRIVTLAKFVKHFKNISEDIKNMPNNTLITYNETDFSIGVIGYKKTK